MTLMTWYWIMMVMAFIGFTISLWYSFEGKKAMALDNMELADRCRRDSRRVLIVGWVCWGAGTVLLTIDFLT